MPPLRSAAMRCCLRHNASDDGFAAMPRRLMTAHMPYYAISLLIFRLLVDAYAAACRRYYASMLRCFTLSCRYQKRFDTPGALLRYADGVSALLRALSVITRYAKDMLIRCLVDAFYGELPIYVDIFARMQFLQPLRYEQYRTFACRHTVTMSRTYARWRAT